MKTALIITAIMLVLAGILGTIFQPAPPSVATANADATGLPWQIEVSPDGGSRVFGISLLSGTLEDVRRRFGDEGQIAIVAAPGEIGSLEAYFETVNIAGITGRIVATAEMDEATLTAMRARAEKVDYMKSSTKKARLHDEDLPRAWAAPLRALAFIPSANLDEAMIQERFGRPAERLRGSEFTEHLLYPDKGLDLILDAKGKEVLQYVAPSRFAQLRQPLLTAAPADE